MSQYFYELDFTLVHGGMHTTWHGQENDRQGRSFSLWPKWYYFSQIKNYFLHYPFSFKIPFHTNSIYPLITCRICWGIGAESAYWTLSLEKKNSTLISEYIKSLHEVVRSVFNTVFRFIPKTSLWGMQLHLHVSMQILQKHLWNINYRIT